MEDADEPVREGSEGLVVGGSAGALSVVERAGAGGIVECGEGLQEQCIAEATGRPGEERAVLRPVELRTMFRMLAQKHLESSYATNPETGEREFVESLVDARKLKVYSDAVAKHNRAIAEETGQLPPRLVPEADSDTRYRYETVGVDLTQIHAGWAQHASEPDQVFVPPPVAVPVPGPMPEEFMGKEERHRLYYEKPSEPPPGPPPGEYVWIDD